MPPDPNSNTNPRPNPNPDRGGNFPDTPEHVSLNTLEDFIKFLEDFQKFVINYLILIFKTSRQFIDNKQSSESETDLRETSCVVPSFRSRSQMFYKIGVLKNFAKFKGKHQF